MFNFQDDDHPYIKMMTAPLIIDGFKFKVHVHRYLYKIFIFIFITSALNLHRLNKINYFNLLTINDSLYLYFKARSSECTCQGILRCPCNYPRCRETDGR